VKLKLNYPVKYEQHDHLKHPKPYYLVNGKWVSQGWVPEIQARKRKWYSDPEVHARQLKIVRDYRLANLEKEKLRLSTWKKNNKEKVREIAIKYLNSERGYFMDMWNSIKRSKHGHDFKNFDNFLQSWLDQKAIHGMKCPATGVEMTMVRKVSGKKGGKRTPTNISRDRILCSRKYSKQNLIFTTWEYNNSKHNITPHGAKAFLRIVRERYGTDEVE